ncbi:cytochrome P450 [Roseinatronobacter alkalisoli]|uniref:Cytochrome P450 n=1 Tax=Roseinatronobacter alkalisoli TaxID=3028235 RepID=A0ABT5T9A6_9RHOB|nr:cytochrome P450 [Roseinatronobacter sp. HJB301]MDD7970503.1 cytochrome P450 [Roseinatronobacter sp. HJB301]
MTRPPMPDHRPDRVPFWRHLGMFRRDILSTQPARLYRAKMAEVKLPFLHSVMVNTPELVRLVLQDRPRDFPKSDRVREGLRLLLGNSVFVTNGDEWARQRRIIDPAFEGGRLRDTFPAMWEAAQAAANRLQAGQIEIEEEMSHAAADVIFRTLFSVPIADGTAAEVYRTFRAHQRSAPILNLAALVPLPRWMPRFFPRQTRTTAARIRALITQMTSARMAAIQAGTAPDDLATKIMTTRDPETGSTFDTAEMVDQVAIFFLAGHETSASALAWTLYLIATNPDWQARLADEAQALAPYIKAGTAPEFGLLKQFPLIRDTFREALRLYPPVPMLVRETAGRECFRGRPLGRGTQVIVSPWHLGRHEDIWQDPHEFRPERWQDPATKRCARDGFIPFSTGPRVCTGAGFAMAEAVLILARLLCTWDFRAIPARVPVPMAHMTVRARDGIWLELRARE